MVGTLYTPLAMSPSSLGGGSGKREPGNDCMRICKPVPLPTKLGIVSFQQNGLFEGIKIKV